MINTPHHPPSVTFGDQQVALGDEYESTDYRDTDPKQPNNRRRVRVVRLYIDGDHPSDARVMNLSTLRETRVSLKQLTSRKWRKVHGVEAVAAVAAHRQP